MSEENKIVLQNPLFPECAGCKIFSSLRELEEEGANLTEGFKLNTLEISCTTTDGNNQVFMKSTVSGSIGNGRTPVKSIYTARVSCPVINRVIY